jgi:hypothetical protein
LIAVVCIFRFCTWAVKDENVGLLEVVASPDDAMYAARLEHFGGAFGAGYCSTYLIVRGGKKASASALSYSDVEDEVVLEGNCGSELEMNWTGPRDLRVRVLKGRVYRLRNKHPQPNVNVAFEFGSEVVRTDLVDPNASGAGR